MKEEGLDNEVQTKDKYNMKEEGLDKEVQTKDYGNKLMGAFNSILFTRKRLFKIIKRLTILKFRLLPPFNKFFKNWNEQQKFSHIPQPAYCNTGTDLDALRFIKSNIWVKDLNSLYTVTNRQKQHYNNFEYDSITKAFYPTKGSCMESINLSNIWKHSYYNPKNLQTTGWQRQSDALFADMMVNTQGIYKAKKIIKGTQQYNKAKRQFSKLLSENRNTLRVQSQDTFDYLVENGNLYYMDYPELRWMENDPKVRQLLGDTPKYQVKFKSTINKSIEYDGYLQIPFAIFANVLDYVKQKRRSFICLGATFNDSDEVYHPFFNPNDQKGKMLRDRWELAKSHMANTDNNDFIIRVHLGNLHYASAIYTTAFSNAAKTHKNLGWLMKQFVQRFSYGFLQINFLANLTLIDNDDPVAQKTMHLRASQSLEIINKYNRLFKIHEFNPYIMGNDCYQSDAIKLSKKYYDNLAVYVDYIFELHERKKDLNEQTYLQFGKIIFREVGSQRFDLITKDLTSQDYKKVKEALKTVMKNLIYLWVVHHGQTFSIVSIGSAYYFVPSFMRKPLSALANYDKPLDNKQKQQWLAPLDIMNDSMALSKQVTYRSERQTIISVWNTFDAVPQIWQEVTNQKGVKIEHHWDQISLDAYKINYQRLINSQLFHMHWLSPEQMPNALNI